METKRLRRIKPQPISPRRLLWRRQRALPPRPQNAYEEMTALLDQFERACRLRLPLLSRRAANTLTNVAAIGGAAAMFPALQFSAPIFMLGWLTVMLPVALLMAYLTISETQLRIARQLSGADDLRAIPALTRVLYWPERGVRNAAAYALARILPRLGEADAAPLDRATRALLQRQLVRFKTQRQQEMTRIIQQAIEHPGADQSQAITGV